MKSFLFFFLLTLFLIQCRSTNSTSRSAQNFQYLKTCNASNAKILFPDANLINEKVDNGQPILSYFARTGNIDCAKWLLDLKANPNQRDARGFTPLIFSVYSNLKMMDLLLENGAELNSETPDAGNALILAAEIGNLEAVQYLIGKGMNVNHLTKNRGTPLMHASIRGHDQVVSHLLKKGADPNLADVLNITPIMHAASNGHVVTVSLLIQYNADIHKKDYKGYTVIFAPSDARNPNEKHLEILDILMKAGANLHDRNDDGDTPLSIAKKRKLSFLIDKLESLGAKE